MARSVFENAGNPNDQTAQIVLGLEQISSALRNLLWQQANEHGLSPLQVQVLLFVYFREQEPVTMTLLAGQFKLSKATMSIAIKSMEQKRFITRKKAEADSRSYILLLTDWGKDIAHIAGFYLEPVRKIVSSIAVAEKEILLKNINGIIGKLQVGS